MVIEWIETEHFLVEYNRYGTVDIIEQREGRNRSRYHTKMFHQPVRASKRQPDTTKD